MWAVKKGGKGKKQPPPPVTVRHWDEEEEPEFIIMGDPKLGTTINTTAETLVTRGGQEYIIGLPIDTPIVVVDEDLRALELESDPRMAAIIPRMKSTLAEMGANMLNTAGVLTIEGEVEMYDEDEEEGEFADKDDDDEGDEEGDLPFVNEVDPDFADRPAPPKTQDEYYDFDARDDTYLEDEEEDLEDMTEAICEVEHEGKLFTVVKFVEPYYVVAKKNGEAWEVLTGDKADQVFDWVLEYDLETEFELLERDARDER